MIVVAVGAAAALGAGLLLLRRMVLAQRLDQHLHRMAEGYDREWVAGYTDGASAAEANPNIAPLTPSEPEDVPSWNPAWRRRYRRRMSQVCATLAQRHGYYDGWLEAQRDMRENWLPNELRDYVDRGLVDLQAWANRKAA